MKKKRGKMTLRPTGLKRVVRTKAFSCCALVLFGLIVVVSVIMANRHDSELLPDDTELGRITPLGELFTEEDVKRTEETLEKYIDFNVEGYERIEENGSNSDVVVVSVTNISDETKSASVEVAAKNDEGKILDISTLYVEDLQTGRTQVFNLFSNSSLSSDVLRDAKYEIYRAYTYELSPEDDSINQESGGE